MRKNLIKSAVCVLGVLLLAISPVFIPGENLIAGYKKASIIAAVEKKTVADSTKNYSVWEIADTLYSKMNLQAVGLSRPAFEYAWKGYCRLLNSGIIKKEGILSICDFSQSSRKKRLYVIDIDDEKLLINTYVAHGRNSGAEYATSFSNQEESHKSSLGFYITRDTYQGDNGLSLKLNGLEKGFNDNAEERNVVMHGSEYVGADFLRYSNCMGRSWGCPAVPEKQTLKIINTIKGGTCFFIYHPTKNYLTASKIINS